MVQDTFRRFAEEKVRPVAEHIHRTNADIPEDVISGLAELGTFGLSIPEEYGGFSTGGEGEYLAMVVATEELSRGSLGVGGSLITRPEILARALVQGATEAQKQEWLPKLASGEVMAAVAVTEPDFGSDSGAITTTATPRRSDDYVINGVKTWCTFAGRADVLMLMARTDPDRSKAHRGAVDVRRSEAARRGSQLRLRSARRRTDGGSRHRHARVPGHALVRGELRQLARSRREPHRWRGRARSRASTCRWPASTTAGCRRRRARSE